MHEFALSEAEIAAIESAINYHFVNQDLLFQAFRRSSFCNEFQQREGRSLPSNEVLEFCGDSMLGAAITSCLIRKYASIAPKEGLAARFNEGDFSTVKSNLSDKSMLSSRMDELGLHRFLFMSNGDREQRIYETPSVKEDLFESIIGAVYLDSGSFDAVLSVVETMLNPEIYLKRSMPKKNAKNRLQELCQARHFSLAYPQIAVRGSEHNTVYTVACEINGEEISRGEGRNKKAAETAAAEEACLIFSVKFGEGEEDDGKNPIQILKEWNDRLGSQKNDILYQTGSLHDGLPPFYAECYVNRKKLARGRGHSLKEAKRNAAAEVLKLLLAEREGKKS